MTRFIEIDIIKGISVTTMVTFHYFYVSNFMGLSNYDISSGILYYLAKFSHLTFLFMVGVNLSIGYERKKEKKISDYDYNVNKLKKAVKLMIAGLIITDITRRLHGNINVKFGIFHFISVAILISLAINKHWSFILITLACLYIINKYKQNLYQYCFSFPLTCFITGIQNIKYGSLDHFSILEYLPIVCYGLIFGKFAYKNNKRIINFKILDKKPNQLISLFQYLGKFSFNFYFLHFILFYFHFYGKGGYPKTTF